VVMDVEGGLATVTLNRAHGNAINVELAEDLTRVCREAARDDSVHGLMLAGAGKLFCPGLDLQELVELDRPEMERFVIDFATCVAELYAFSKPMVAAIHGHAVAGGCVLTLAADWRVLKAGAMVGLNEVRVGVPLPFGVSLILRESVPRLHLEEVALLGKNYRDDDALSAGLVHEVHAGESFEEHCRQRLREFVSRDLGALMITKRFLRSSIVERIRENGTRDVPEFLDAWYRPQTQARIHAIVDELRQRD
jgi:Delta3-Delta2-enoyl-CoA isomerase